METVILHFCFSTDVLDITDSMCAFSFSCSGETGTEIERFQIIAEKHLSDVDNPTCIQWKQQ